MNNELVVIGVLSNTHGLTGDMKLYLFTNANEILRKVSEYVLKNKDETQSLNIKFEKVKKHSDHYIVHIAGIETIAEAEKLKGLYVYVKKEFLPKLQEGQYYFFELVGCTVYDQDNNYLGEVKEVIETGNNDVLSVKKDKQEFLIPVIEDYVRLIDKEGKRIYIKMPEWL